jgi:hypothetical protein
LYEPPSFDLVVFILLNRRCENEGDKIMDSGVNHVLGGVFAVRYNWMRGG